jgi:hypothetical protein
MSKHSDMRNKSIDPRSDVDVSTRVRFVNAPCNHQILMKILPSRIASIGISVLETRIHGAKGKLGTVAALSPLTIIPDKGTNASNRTFGLLCIKTENPEHFRYP